jgi:hypothetical protein
MPRPALFRCLCKLEAHAPHNCSKLFAGGVCLIVKAGALSCDGAGPVTEAQLRRSAALRELCGSSVGTATLALSLEAFTLWQAHADRAEAFSAASVHPLDAVTIWQVCVVPCQLRSSI